MRKHPADPSSRRTGSNQLSGSSAEAGPHRSRQATPVPFEIERTMAAIAGEEVVAASARQQDLYAVATRELADEENVQRRRIRERFIQLDDHLFQAVRHRQ